jgi:hypothetical protein
MPIRLIAAALIALALLSTPAHATDRAPKLLA